MLKKTTRKDSQMNRFSEYVSLGHPDKITDYITSYILDRYLEKDPLTRYALEVQIKDNYVTLAGEITSTAHFSPDLRAAFVRQAVNEIGYTKAYQDKWGAQNTICGDDLIVAEHISAQSPDIAVGVDNNGFGDQGHFYGYAENNAGTKYMPQDYYLAKDLGLSLYQNAKQNGVGGLDIKTLIEVDDNGQIDKIIAAIPTKTDTEYAAVKCFVNNWAEKQGADVNALNTAGKIIVNGTGTYVIHGPIGDSGTTGRKLAVDFYGGNCPVGGGTTWTKDGSKADVSLNIYARKVAVQKLLENKDKMPDVFSCVAGISCCIGRPQTTIYIRYFAKNGSLIGCETFEKVFDIKQLTRSLQLDKPVFAQMCKNGIFSVVDEAL